MRATTVLVVLLLGALAHPSVLAWTSIPEEAYKVVAVSTVYGGGVGHLWGHPEYGARLWLDSLGCTCEFGFTIGGTQTKTATPLGTLVLDRWTGPNNDRFVGGYFVEDAPDDPAFNATRHLANRTAFGGGKLAGWEITVIGHT